MSDQSGQRPSWLHEPCPSWCEHVHREDDHVEDRQHRSEGTLLSAVVGEMDVIAMRRVGRGTDLVVQRVQAVGASDSWIVIADTESPSPSFDLSAESAERLGAVLRGELVEATD